MEKEPLKKAARKVLEEFHSGIEKMTEHLNKGMVDFISDNLDLEELIGKIGETGLSGILNGGVPGFDPYKILGLEKTATDEEVKKRFRELIVKVHPDTSETKGTEALAQIITTAYSMIGKERKWE